MSLDPEKFLRGLFDEAVRAAAPARCLAAHLPPAPKGRTIVIGAGKAAASMAKVVEDHWRGPLEGLVITRYGHGEPLEHIRLVEAGHPVPDAEGARAAEAILDLVSDLDADDLVLCLFSGGGSSLLAMPGPGITLQDKQKINKALLMSGASIGEMNTVRKKLSALKGGRLAVAAWPARVVTLMISDVPGDDPSVIASGPTVPDLTSVAEARDILARYGIDVPLSVAAFLESEAAIPPKADHPAFAAAETHVIATPQASLQAAADLARSQGIEPVILGDRIEGEAREVARVMAGIARQVREHGQPAQRPAVLISGGETTVTVKASGASTGRGGRNAEFLLAFALAMAGEDAIYALAADTDGIDGTEDNAGAVYSPATLARAKGLSLEAAEYLARHDAYGFFQRLGGLVMTGPTRTNVNDFRAILVL
ncbi:glycerate kinase type-2 family protein [Sneathiella chinensis]|uniref:Hydroxypyruvate reductase n=1 Tax=Sneathiella chinensis TaxID=349750 RepID=A0ABQ5U4V4_9PROT|nr:glycerate kinase [Sneathiella chinensis]GLQ06710.1 hydroxypyruvate reductase [Sneathiella chinensis]